MQEGIPIDPTNRPDVLQWQNTVTLNRRICADRFGTNGTMIHANTLCTINRRNLGACAADAGGPLTTRGTTKILIGIFSWHQATCGSGLPDVYVRIYPHLRFIRAAIAQ